MKKFLKNILSVFFISLFLFKVEKISTHGGSIRIYIKKGKNIKIEKSVKDLLNEEEKFGIKKYLAPILIPNFES